MQLLTICPNDGEASFVTSMLEAEGILCHRSENAVELDGPVQVRVFVDEADLSKARELLANVQRERRENPSERKDLDPSDYYPFVGVTLFLVMVWIFVRGLYNVYHLWVASEFGRWDLFSMDTLVALFVEGVKDILICFIPCGLISYLGALVAMLLRKSRHSSQRTR